jgi:hypothetical protein
MSADAIEGALSPRAASEWVRACKVPVCSITAITRRASQCACQCAPRRQSARRAGTTRRCGRVCGHAVVTAIGGAWCDDARRAAASTQRDGHGAHERRVARRVGSSIAWRADDVISAAGRGRTRRRRIDDDTLDIGQEGSRAAHTGQLGITCTYTHIETDLMCVDRQHIFALNSTRCICCCNR